MSKHTHIRCFNLADMDHRILLEKALMKQRNISFEQAIEVGNNMVDVLDDNGLFDHEEMWVTGVTCNRPHIKTVIAEGAVFTIVGDKVQIKGHDDALMALDGTVYVRI